MQAAQLFRLFRHLLLPAWWVRRDFTPQLLRTLEAAIGVSETRHRGELRLVLETHLPLQGLWRNQSSRARAIELFSQLRVWDTEYNSGVLVYVQLVDRKVEIVADRGINAKVGPEVWLEICRRIETTFRDRRFEAGIQAALADITEILSQHFPALDAPADKGQKVNELTDAPLLL